MQAPIDSRFNAAPEARLSAIFQTLIFSGFDAVQNLFVPPTAVMCLIVSYAPVVAMFDEPASFGKFHFQPGQDTPCAGRSELSIYSASPARVTVRFSVMQS